jgi:AAA ATPase domain
MSAAGANVGSGMFIGRLAERAALGRLLQAPRAGRSGVLVVRGELGVGKTALLEDAVASAAGLRIARAAGVESEMERVQPAARTAGAGPA